MRCYGEAAFFCGFKRSLYHSTWRSFRYRSAPEFGARSVGALYGWSTSFWGISKRAFFSGARFTPRVRVFESGLPLQIANDFFWYPFPPKTN